MTAPARTPIEPATLAAGRSPVAGWVALGLVASALVGLAISGGAAPTEISDAGAFVRWGLPVTKALSWAAVIPALGLLGGAAFIVPERRTTNRRIEATRLAAIFALLWFLAKAVHLVLTFADLAGLPVTDPAMYRQLWTFVFQLEVTRVLAIVTLIALFVGVTALVATSRATMAWLTVLTVLAVVLPGLNGHAGGQETHESAVNSAAIHYGGVAIWFSGLVALLLLRGRLGRDLGVCVRRFSVLATWAFALVGLAGLQQGLIRLGGFSGIFTTYGALLHVKVLAFVLLGWFGWRQRRAIAAVLDRDTGDGRTFARLATLEVAIMSVAAGVGVALSRTRPPAQDPAPGRSMVEILTGFPDPGPMAPGDWVTRWQINWLFLTLGLLMMGLYVAGVIRLHRRGDSWLWWRTTLWVAGWLLWIYFTNGAPEVWGRVQFSMHMIMHMGVAMVIPLFLVPAAPLTLALRALPARPDRTWGPREVLLKITHSRVSRVLANPIVASAFFFFSMAAFYYTPLFELALTTHVGHLLMMGHFLLTGYLFVWVLVGVDPGPPRWPPLALLTVLFATVGFHAFFGVAITGSEAQLAPGFFNVIDLPWLTNPLLDQHTAGMIAWGVGEAPTLILAVIVAFQWQRNDAKAAARLDRQAERDGEADLAAYNAWLARLRQENPDRKD